ncbi:uncharacterized protein LOC129771609 isoform X2 [Toxorhynchites rutilus septentrionalis]|uniref:uncharacterized protein LOC129771609 isoform X2 n=1 Tax=Toxorhynchites rutilus septentrionalis TaxID=329112 RepID=UPI00247AB30B|nr:uncharacterized protein LOC129771609 isoform X2 [Toxorhynchites rutilus septentrionalis]
MCSKLYNRWKRPLKSCAANTNFDNPLQSEIEKQAEVDVGIFRSLRKFFRRSTEEEKILLLEKKYLKKYLQYYKHYTDGMTLVEMRFAKRFLDSSAIPKPCLEVEPTDSPFTCCQYFCFKKNSKTTPKAGKRVTFKQRLVQSRQINVSLESSDDEIGNATSNEAPVGSSSVRTSIVTAVDTNHSSIDDNDSDFQEVSLGKTE